MPCFVSLYSGYNSNRRSAVNWMVSLAVCLAIFNSVACQGAPACPAGQYSTPVGCMPCMPGCTSCADGLSCLACDADHRLTTTKGCSSCPLTCDTCRLTTSGTAAECATCKPGYYKPTNMASASYLCLQCPFNCKYCNSKGDCTTCNDGYKVTNLGNCKKQVLNAETKSKVGTIVGGTVAGFAGLVIIVVVICLVCRKKQQVSPAIGSNNGHRDIQTFDPSKGQAFDESGFGLIQQDPGFSREPPGLKGYPPGFAGSYPNHSLPTGIPMSNPYGPPPPGYGPPPAYPPAGGYQLPPGFGQAAPPAHMPIV